MTHHQITPETIALYQQRARLLRSETFLNFFFGVAPTSRSHSVSASSIGCNSNRMDTVEKAA